MIQKLVSLFCAVLIISCNTSDNEKDDSEIFIAKETTIHCYSRISGKDTAILTLIVTGTRVSGDLTYHFFEKDRNTGTIKGEMFGDTLKAEYTFRSEGKESVREVSFLKKEVDFIQGYGDMEEIKDKLIFKKDAAMNFSDSILFKNIPCPDQK